MSHQREKKQKRDDGPSSSTGTWVINQTTGDVTLEDATRASIVVDVYPVSMASLFPPLLLSTTKGSEAPTQCLYAIRCETLEKDVLGAVKQCYAKIPSLRQKSNLATDEYRRKEKSSLIEQKRTCHREDTRFFQHEPKRPRDMMSSIFTPSSSLTVQGVLNFQVHSPEDTIPPRSKATESMPFCGSAPMSIMSEDIKTMHNGDFFWTTSPKTNGLRFFLLACRFYNQPMLIMISRSNELYLVNFGDDPNAMFPEGLMDGTLWDGELVPLRPTSRADTRQRFAYIAYDCLHTFGVPCGDQNYLVRLQNAYHSFLTFPPMLQSKSSLSNDYHWEVRVKDVYGLTQLPDLLSKIWPRLDHSTDGHIFTAADAPVVPGLAKMPWPAWPAASSTTPKEMKTTIYRLKRGNDNTIDFRCVAVESTETLELYSSEKRGTEFRMFAQTKPFLFEKVSDIVTRLGLSAQVTTKAHVFQELQGKIVECRFVREWNAFRLENLRQDKLMPNPYYSACNTWRNIQENLNLVALFPKGTLSAEQREWLEKWETNPKQEEQDAPNIMKDDINWVTIQFDEAASLAQQERDANIAPLAPVPLSKAIFL